jgi:hypothetical protein
VNRNMNPVDDYLAQSYRRDVLGTQLTVTAPEPTPETIAEVKARVAQIDGLRLGATLASRDYVSYQNRRALVRLLAELERD